MKPRLQRQVNPKIVVVVILALLVVVQVAWWRGLVMRPKSGPPGRMGGGGGPGHVVAIVGREDVRVETLAGDPEPGYVDGPASRARFDGPTGLCMDPQGSLYVADTRNHRIRKISSVGKTTTLAGGEPGCLDGPALQARFNAPCGVAVAPDGAVYIADTGNHRIRCLRDGQVTTLAGSAAGMADGQGASARFDLPCALAYLPGQHPYLLVADAGNHRVCEVDLTGRVLHTQALPGSPTGVASTSPPAVSVPQAGSLLVGPKALHHIPIDAGAYSADPEARRLFLGMPVAACPAPGGWFAADGGHGAVFHIHDGKAEVLAGLCLPTGNRRVWRDDTGNRAGFGQIANLVADGAGHLYVSDTTNNVIRKVTLPR